MVRATAACARDAERNRKGTGTLSRGPQFLLLCEAAQFSTAHEAITVSGFPIVDQQASKQKQAGKMGETGTIGVGIDNQSNASQASNKWGRGVTGQGGVAKYKGRHETVNTTKPRDNVICRDWSATHTEPLPDNQTGRGKQADSKHKHERSKADRGQR